MGREEEEDGQTQTPGEETEIADGSEQRRRRRDCNQSVFIFSTNHRIIRQLNKNVKMI